MGRGSERIQMANRYMKKCSTSLITGEMQIKPTMRLSPHTCYNGWRQEITSVGKDVGKREPLCTGDGIVNWCSPYGKQYGGSSKKLKIKLTYDPTIPLLGIYLKEMKTLTWKDTCTSMFTAALYTIAKTWKQPKCPWMDGWMDGWMGCMDEENVVCMYACIYIYIYIHTHTHTHMWKSECVIKLLLVLQTKIKTKLLAFF